MRLVEALGALRFRSDFERKRLFGEQDSEQQNTLGGGIYNPNASAATYQRLHALAAEALQAGFPVVIDATYLKTEQRHAAWQIAESTGTPFLILDCQAPDEVVATWLKQRQTEGLDPSDAPADVILAQRQNLEPLDAAETAQSYRVDTHDAATLDNLISQIRKRLPGL